MKYDIFPEFRNNRQQNVFLFLANLFFLQITSDVSKIWKKCQHDFTFIFNILSETFIDFACICLVLEIKNIVNLTKTRYR